MKTTLLILAVVVGLVIYFMIKNYNVKVNLTKKKSNTPGVLDNSEPTESPNKDKVDM